MTSAELPTEKVLAACVAKVKAREALKRENPHARGKDQEKRFTVTRRIHEIEALLLICEAASVANEKKVRVSTKDFAAIADFYKSK